MTLPLKLVLRFFGAHPWQAALCVVGVALGIAVVLAIDVANQSARNAFQLASDTVSGGATHSIVGDATGIDEDFYTELRVSRGLRNIHPVVTGYVELMGQRYRVLGIDPLAGSAGQGHAGFGNLDAGLLLGTHNAALLLDSTASRLGLKIPAQTKVRIGGVEHELNIVGTLSPQQSIYQEGLRNMLVMDISAAQSLLGMIGKLSQIDILDGETHAIESVLPTHLFLTSSDSRRRSLEQITRAFHTNLTALSLLALVIGAFLIYNTMTVSVLQRREQFAVLRTLGFTAREIFAGIMIEAAIIALVGLVLGTLSGIWLAGFLLELVGGTINDLYSAVAIESKAVTAYSFLKATALAAGATLVAAWYPAWEAMRTPPAVNKIRSILESNTRALGRRLAWTGVGLMVLAVCILLLSERSIVLGFAALFLIIMGTTLLTPAFMVRFLDTTNPLLESVLGVVGRMAGRGVKASLSRTQVAVAALAVAVSAVVGVSVMISSFRLSVESWLGNFLRADVYVAQQHTHRATGINPQLIEDILSLQQVESINTGRWTSLNTSMGPIQLFVAGLNRKGFENYQFVDAESEDLWPSFERGEGVIISEPFAYHHEKEVGDAIELVTIKGKHSFEVLGIFSDYGSDRGVVVMPRQTYLNHWNDDAITSFSIYLHNNVDSTQFIDQLNRNQLVEKTLRVRGNRNLRERSLEIFDRTFTITGIVRLLAVIIAVVGILSALMAIQLERAREFSVLRVTGMSTRQLWGLVTTESGLMGFTAGIIACPLGLIMAWVLIYIINRRSFGWSMDLHFSIEPWIVALVLSILAAVTAGLYPALKMARTKPADALNYE